MHVVGVERQPDPIVPQDLDRIATAAPEDVEVASVRIELCLNLGDGADQAAWLCWVGTTSMPSANLTPAMIFGN